MALICMAVWDTEENNRTWMTDRTLHSLLNTVDWSKHRLIVSDNGSCDETLALYDTMVDEIFPKGKMQVIYNGKNLGTARAVNKGIALRNPGENVCKIDNDCVIEEKNWLDRLEDCVEREPTLGVIGLKRKDLAENPFYPQSHFYHSELVMLQPIMGKRWLIVEQVHHVIGTCQLVSSLLLDKIGYYYQGGGLYGFDDPLLAVRARVAGFWCAFYPHINIDHIDPGATPYQQWKEKYATQCGEHCKRISEEYQTGKRPIYHGPEDE